MKTLAVVSILALALSGCATGYYHRGYTGYNSGYTSGRYYDNYGESYYRPGASISIERYYSPPRFSPPRHEHRHRHDIHNDWRPPLPQLNRHGFDRGDWGHGDHFRRHDHFVEQAPRRGFDGPSMPGYSDPERHRHNSDMNRGEGHRHFPGR